MNYFMMVLISYLFVFVLHKYWFIHYSDKLGVDFRAIRYPGVISSAKYAFNGTTDYSTGK